MNSSAHLEMNELLSNPSPRPETQSEMQFLLINDQLMFPAARLTPLLRRFHCTQGWDDCYFRADHKAQRGIIQRYN